MMGHDTLRGWKAIAGHLQTSVRTALRWEREFGLPVQRVKGARGDLVFADPVELERWRRGQGRSVADAGAADITELEAAPEPSVPSGVDESILSADASPATRPWFRTGRGIAGLLTLAAGIGVAILLAFILAPARRPSAERLGSTAAGGRGANVPVVTGRASSLDVNLVRVTVEGTAPQSATLGIFDGSMASIIAERGPAVGFATRRHSESLTVTLLLLSPGKGPSGGTAHQVGSLQLGPRRPVSWSHEGVTMQVEWLGSRPAAPDAPESDARRERLCRITCDRFVFSAAAVETTCGHCCDPTACRHSQ